jgi:outer membrane protein
VIPPPLIEDLPLAQAVQEAMTKRPDVLQTTLNLTSDDINIQAVRNALLPTVTFSGFVSSTGLAGNTRTKPPVTSGFFDAMDTVFQSDFPEYQAAITLNIPIRNRPAQADMARALVLQQQDNARLQQLRNTVSVDVQTAQITLQLDRTAVTAAVKTRELNEQSLAAEQTKFQLGASTIFLVVTAQQTLSAAASAEVRAQVNLVEARANFERAMGRTLEVNRINISDAKSGTMPANARIPGTSVSGQLIGQGLR